MGHKSAFLTEEAGVLECYGRFFNEDDEDCKDCSMSGDCETLTALRRSQKVSVRNGLRTRQEETKKRHQAAEIGSRTEEEEENERRAPWTEAQAPHTPPEWNQQQYHPQPYPEFQYPAPPNVQPGLHSSANIIPHPAPHLTYMMSNPVDCPMPMEGEPWWARIAKNVTSGALSEGGRQFYEFFRRFRF